MKGVVLTVYGSIKSISCQHDFENDCIRWTLEIDAMPNPQPDDSMFVHFSTSRWEEIDFRTGDQIGCVGSVLGFLDGLRKIVQAELSASPKPALKVHVEASLVRNLTREFMWTVPE